MQALDECGQFSCRHLTKPLLLRLLPLADVAGTAAGGSDTLLTPSGGGGAGSQQQGSVAKVFDILTRGESGLAQQFESVVKQEVGAPAGSLAAAHAELGALVYADWQLPPS